MRLFTTIRPYRREWLKPDLFAAFTVWAVLVPEALAYATIAGVSPIVGLYAAPGALLLYAAIGTSRNLITGANAAAAALSAAVVGGIVAGDSGAFAQTTAALAICIGIIAVVAGIARLGFVVNFISIPVLRGFITGLALTIIAGQVPHLFGVQSSDGDFFDRVWVFITNLNEIDPVTAAIGLGSLAFILYCRYFHPAIPGSLISVGVGIIVVSAFDLGANGVAIIGPIEGGLPSPSIPEAGFADLGALVVGAAGVMIVGFAEGLASAGANPSDDEKVDPNRELVGMGMANVSGGLAGGFVVTGSVSKTAINAAAGARSQLVGIVVAGLVVLTMLFFSGVFESLPEAALAAVVIAALIHVVDIHSLRTYYRILDYGNELNPANRPDFIAAVAALLGVMVFDILPGLFIGIVASLGLLLYRSSMPHVARLGELGSGSGHWGDVKRHPDARELPDVLVLRIEAALFFANADQIKSIVTGMVNDSTSAVVLDLETVPFIDLTGALMLQALSSELGRKGIRMAIARDVGQVEDLIRSTGMEDLLDNAFVSIRQAVSAMSRNSQIVSPERPDRETGQ